MEGSSSGNSKGGGKFARSVVDPNLKKCKDDSTNVTYVIPASELDIVQRDGVDSIVNKESTILPKPRKKARRSLGMISILVLLSQRGAIVNIVIPNGR
jgi:hypothetical protein